MHFVAQAVKRHALIAFPVHPVQTRQRRFDRNVVQVEPLEFHQRAVQDVKVCGGASRRHQEQKRVQVGFLRHDAVFHEVFSDNRPRDAAFFVFTGFDVDSGTLHDNLDGALNGLSGTASPEAFNVPDRREEAAVLHSPAKCRARIHGILPKCAVARSFCHGRIDRQRSVDRIGVAGRHILEVGIVEAFVVNVALLSPDVCILLQNLRRLRKTGLLFVNGLRNQNAWIFRTKLKLKRRQFLH